MRQAGMVNQAVVGLVGVAALAAALHAQGGATTAAPEARAVVVTKVVARALDRPLAVPGELIAFQDVEIRAKVPGFVESVSVDRGSLVRRGQPLVHVVAPELGSQRSEANARVQSAAS